MRRRLLIGFLTAIFMGASLSFSNLAAAPGYSSNNSIKQVVKARKSALPAQNIHNSKPVPPAVVTPQVTQPAHSRAKTVAAKSNVVSIPSLGFQAPIVEVGTTPDNAIDVPSSMKVGRWTGSALPGKPGAVFLDGHVDGIFARLSRVTVGQIITVTYGGQMYSYRVTHTEVVPLATIDMNRALSVLGGTEGLNLMTCAGTYIPSTGTYDQRLVVYTIRI